MKLRIPSKKPENNYGIIDEGFDGSDARQWAIALFIDTIVQGLNIS